MKGRISLTDRKYWDSEYRHGFAEYNPDFIRFRDLYKRYLKPRVKPGMTCIEIGCHPGNNLVYFAKTYGLRISGIDFVSDFIVMEDYLQKNGVQGYKLFNEDFTKYDICESYDFVCSFGFIEHFQDFEGIIEKHVTLVKPGGLLFISCPNLGCIHYFLQIIFNRDNLKMHNRMAANLESWRTILYRNGMEILYHQYYGTFKFWVNPRSENTVNRKLINHISTIGRIVEKRIDLPNPLTSPYLVSISRKPLTK